MNKYTPNVSHQIKEGKFGYYENFHCMQNAAGNLKIPQRLFQEVSLAGPKNWEYLTNGCL